MPILQRAKAFFYIYTRSLTSPAYYKEILKTKLSLSFKFYTGLIAIISVITAISATAWAMPQINKGIGDAISKVKQAYPADLVISIKGGQWAINRPEPFVVPFEFNTTPPAAETPNTPAPPKNLVVLYHNGTLDDLKTYDTLMLVNSTNLILRDTNKTSVYPLKEFPDTVINQQAVFQLIDSVMQVTKFIPYILFLASLFGLAVYFGIYRVIYLFIVGGLIWLASRITTDGLKLKFSQAYQISLHTMVLPITISFLFDIARYNPLNGIPFWFTAVNVVFALIVLAYLQRHKDDTETSMTTRQPITPMNQEPPTPLISEPPANPLNTEK
jgi:hypothetical protein